LRSRSLPAADVEALAGVRAFVRASAGELGAAGRAVDDLVQAVDEVACNVILYGYHGTPGPLEVSVERRGEAIEVTLRDEAPTFDPTSVPAPAPGSAPKAWGRSGMGLQLMRSMMDEVHHRARPEGGNELTMRRAIHRPGEED
jgi:serine/threonine-protein kinase RsbW